MSRDVQLVVPNKMCPTYLQLPLFIKPSKIIKKHPIPSLPLFEETAKILRGSLEGQNIGEINFVCRQHHLASTIKLYEFLRSLGNVHASGKVYSFNPAVEETMRHLGVNIVPITKPIRPGYYYESSVSSAKRLWGNVCKGIRDTTQIIVLSDGGDLFATMPRHLKLTYPMAGVEQTRGGLYSIALQEELFPIVDVAGSAAKREIESQLIANAIVKKIIAYLPELATNKKLVCGIIGNGAIGSALAIHLLQKGYQVMFYDENKDAFNKLLDKNLPRAPSIKSLISGADYIFGCTGTDVTQSIRPFVFEGRKIFINCASEDREFRTALRELTTSNDYIYRPLDDVVVKSIQSELVFMYGGFPINFAPLPKLSSDQDKKMVPRHADPTCLPAAQIELTQSLLALGITQAILNAKRVVGDARIQRQCLDPYGQRYIVTRWLLRNGESVSSEKMQKFQDIDWITRNSGGDYMPNQHFKRCFKSIPLHDVPANVIDAISQKFCLL